MRPALAIAAFLVLLLGASPASASQSPLTGREAALAVREEVGANWALLETASGRPESRSTTFSAECMGVTPRRRLCSWEASNPDRGQEAKGLAVVRARSGGAAARLYAYRCQARDGLDCL
jgi:hypothetical protein